MGLQRFPYVDYTGGVNLRDGPFNLEVYEAQNARDVVLTQRGQLSQRQGKVRLDTSGFPLSGSPPTKVADNMFSWYIGTSRLLMFSIDGSVYSMTTSGVLTLRFAGTAGTIWCFASDQNAAGADRLWMMNGVDAPQRWDGVAGTTSAWANSPPNGTMLKVWQNKMIVSGLASAPQRVLWSAIGDPENPGSAYGNATSGGNWIDIRATEDDRDPVTWIDLASDNLIVFKRRSTWGVFDPVTFANRRLGEPGCEDRFQSCELYGQLFFLCRTGLYSVSPNTSPELESLSIDPIFSQRSNPVGVLNLGEISKARLHISRDRRILLAIPIGDGTRNNLLCEGMPDLRRILHVGGRRILGPMPWVFHSYSCSSLATFRQVNLDSVVAGASDVTGVHTLFTGSDDDGEPIDGFWFGSWQAVQKEEPFERVRRINVEHEGRVIVELYQDLKSDAAKFSALLTRPGAEDPLWDGGTWDGGTWDPASEVGLSRCRPEKRGRYHAVKYKSAPPTEAPLLPGDDVFPADDLFPGSVLTPSTFTVYAAELAIRGGKEIT